MEKTERFDFGDKPQAHPDVSFPEAETSASSRTLWRLSAGYLYRLGALELGQDAVGQDLFGVPVCFV